MTRLLSSFEPDGSWGSSLANTFMGWTSSAPTPPPRRYKSKTRPIADDDDLWISLAGLSVVNNPPYMPLELPSRYSIPPQTPILYPTLVSRHPPPTPILYPNPMRTSRTVQRAPSPISSHSISPPLQSSATGRSDFLSANLSSGNARSSPRTAQPNRRRPRPTRPPREPVFRPLDDAESADPPPAYSAVDPLAPQPRPLPQEAEPVTWRDGLRLQRSNRSSSKWSLSNWRDSHQRRRTDGETIRPRKIRGNVRAARGALSQNIGRASQMVKDVPSTALRTHERWHIMRAKNKLQWLRKNGFLSDQERMLTRELRG